MVKRCVVCLKQETRGISSFHRFPADKNLQQSWLKMLNRPDLTDVSNYRVCDSHFDPSSFKINQINNKQVSTTKIHKRLKRGAVPVSSITTTQSTHSTRSVSTQTDLDLNHLSNLFDKLSMYEQKLCSTTICIERFRDDDTNIKYYTGFRSYKIFCLVFELLQVSYW
ncbi:unnamed protein product [Rotaria sordida]|uniref:THAP-type domain-containing protein n=1 Tax=Rotaria sordida TaxID=392033 RepID=A0A819VDQ9_9BILA|nr:unnamed protein product [Rotaria sordida]CAF4107299.1 unnamed protein product [Rotaria sordida]